MNPAFEVALYYSTDEKSSDENYTNTTSHSGFDIIAESIQCL